MINSIPRNKIFKSVFLTTVFKAIQLKEQEDYIVDNENKYLFDLLNINDFKKEKTKIFSESKFALTVADAHRNTNYNLNNFTRCFIELLEELKAKDIYIFFELNESWFYQKNSYPPVRKSLLFLKNFIKNKNSYDGLKLKADEIPIMLRILYWLARGNASLPKIWINPAGEKILFHLNKYGNLQYIISKRLNENNFLKLLCNKGFRKIEYYEEGRFIK